MRRNIFYGLILGFFVGSLLFKANTGLASSQKSSDYVSNCKKFDGIGGGFCVHQTLENPSDDVLYFLHGIRGNERSWQREIYYTEQLRRYWKANGLKLPTIVSVSFGEVWLLASKNDSPVSGLFELFTMKVLPEIETSMGGLKGRRILLGNSMGGVNAIQLSLKTDLFDKAAIVCSQMAEFSPFLPREEIDQHIRRTSAWGHFKDRTPELVTKSVDEMLAVMRAFYPTEESWDTGDPIKLSQSPFSTKTELYVTVGYHDEYAIYEANEKFIENLKNVGFKVQWRPQWGGHCVVDVSSLARFLVD